MKWMAPALLSLAIFAAYQHGQMGCADSRWSIPTAISLLDHHDVDLDEFPRMLALHRLYATERVNGHVLGIYPFGTPLVAAPAVALLRPAAAFTFRRFPSIAERIRSEQRSERGCDLAGGEPVLDAHSWFERLIASALVAATAFLLFRIAADDLPTAAAAVLVLVFAFGTSAWSAASRALWQHAPSMLVLTAALMLQRRASRFWLLGALLGFAYVIRPTNAIPIALSAIWVMYGHRDRALRFAAGLVVVLAVFVAANYRVYGAALSPYYHPGYWGRSIFVTEALAGTLVSPGRGLFVYSPVLLFCAAGVALMIRRRSITSLDVMLVAAIVLHWLALAVAAPTWWGGYSYGPRFFADMLPYAFCLLVPFMAWLWATPRPGVVALFALAAAVSVLMQAQGVFNPSALVWNAEPITIDADSPRLWDWRYPPFLAGLIDNPHTPVDVRAVPCDAAPGAPRDLRVVASASKHTVRMAWDAGPGAVARYLMESGSAPGANNFPAREVADVAARELTVSSVPAGTYYVRVRADNACGTSPPSNEVRVVVEK
jgi:hypothetical protein